jgi:hypothetical protein
MFLVPLLFVLAADTLTLELDAWVPKRMASAHVAAVGVALVSEGGAREWYHGVQNVLTRTPVGRETSWPVRAFGSSRSEVATPHSRVGVVLSPGLVVLGVLSALCWLALIPVSAVTRQEWRFGRWHEVLAIVLAIPFTWIFLRRGGPVMATYFTATATTMLLVPLALAAISWRKSRIRAIAILLAAGLAAWSIRGLAAPLPSNFDGGPAEGASLGQLQRAALKALHADSLERTELGFTPLGGRWIAHDRSRGAETLLVLLPSRDLGVIAVSNSGETTRLLEEIVDSLTQ